MDQGGHAFAKRNRRIVWQDFRVAPQRAWPRFQAFKVQRSRRATQVVPRQERLPADTEVLFNGWVIFLAASRAFQLKDIQRFGHHRKSLAHAFLPIHSRLRPTIFRRTSIGEAWGME